MTDRSLVFSSSFPVVDGVASDPGLSLSLASAQSLGLPPKLCCSFYSSGSSARRLTSLEIAPRMRFQFSRSFGIRRTGPMVARFAGLLFQSSPTGHFVQTRS